VFIQIVWGLITFRTSAYSWKLLHPIYFRWQSLLRGRVCSRIQISCIV